MLSGYRFSPADLSRLWMGSCVRAHKLSVDMAAKSPGERPAMGVRHVTVVPTNFQPADDEESDEYTDE